jgi:hypothetical protein
LLRLVVAINNKTQRRQRPGLLQRRHVVLLNNLPPPERPSRSHPPPAERPCPRHRNARTGASRHRNARQILRCRRSLASERQRENADENVAFVGLLSLVFGRQRTPTTVRQRQILCRDERPTRNKISDDPHATKFPTTDTQQNSPRRRTALAQTNVVGALFVASRIR